jgi:hypothetical protein
MFIGITFEFFVARRAMVASHFIAKTFAKSTF